MHTLLTTTLRARGPVRHMAILFAATALAGCPEPVPTLDAGVVDEPDPTEDAGPPLLHDGGQVDCPTVTAFMEGDACANEGQVCRSLLCIFPGPSCLELACVDGVWRNVVDEVDAGPGDAGAEPIRTVLEEPLFRGLPVDNLFLDPEMTLSSSAGFSFYNASATQFVVAERVLSPDLPLGTNAVRIRKSTNPSGVVILGAARVRSGAGMVQIDVGRPIGAPEVNAPSISLVGLFADGTEAALALMSAGDPIVSGDVRWQRHIAAFEEGPVAWAYLVVSETHGTDLLLAAPVLVALDLLWVRSVVDLESFRASRRPLLDVEKRGLARVSAADRDRLQSPSPLRAPTSIQLSRPPRQHLAGPFVRGR